MDNVNVNTFFVSEKISKIRWLPQLEPNQFLTGSWDNSNQNNIKLWRLVRNEYSDNENEFIPKCIDKIPYSNDITGIELLDSMKFIHSSSDGRLRIVNIGVEYQNLVEKDKSDIIHKTKFGNSAPCTGISIFDKNIASIGEDGKLNILTTNQLKLIRQMKFVDSCSLMALTYINHNEILVANRMGVIRIFDIRSQDHETKNTLIVSYENENRSNFATSICYHPTQQHIIFAGSDEGSITIWDLRQPTFPASYLSAHTSPITEINFDRTHQIKLYTASENGELWQWNQNNSTDITKMNTTTIQDLTLNSEVNTWLNGERTKSKINVTSIISGIGKAINCFDAYGSNIICGCDNEAVYYVNNMF